MSGLGHFRGMCEFCKREVTTQDRGAFRVRGWEYERQAGGANQIVGKERQPDRIAHATCVTAAIRKERKGLRGQQALLAVLVLLLSGCGSEARQDADKAGQRVDRGPAEVIAMPDAFRNVAHKCDGHGHRVYSNSTGGSGKSAQLFVIEDPSCAGDSR